MCRAAYAGPLTTTSRHIFITKIIGADGKASSVISAQPLSNQSIRVNGTWDGERWEGNQYVTTKCSNSGALFLLITLCSRDDIRHLVGSCIGSDSYLSRFCGGVLVWRGSLTGPFGPRSLQKLCRAKTSFQNLLRHERNQLTAA